MRSIHYPLLHFPIDNQAVMGLLIGTDYQVVDKDLQSLQKVMLDYLQRTYKKEGDYEYLSIKNPKLKTIRIKVRPAFRDHSGGYPGTNFFNVPVHLIYGESEQEGYECYLPMLREHFFYYDTKQLNSLASYFAGNILNQYAPKSLLRHLRMPDPKLSFITLRVHEDRMYDWSSGYTPRYYQLERLAEQFPFKKTVKSKANINPDAAWEREQWVGKVVEKLLVFRTNVLIVGNKGVGKTAILKQALRKINTLSKKEKWNYTFWKILPQRIVASSKYLGEWEEAVELLIEDLEAANGILWVEDIIRMLQAGGEGPEDSVAAFLISYLQQGKLQLIGEVTEQELESMQRLLPGFAENFQTVRIPELRESEIRSIIHQFAQHCEQKVKVVISEEAQDHLYRLMTRYVPYESFPGKAVKFLGVTVSNSLQHKQKRVDKKAVINQFVKQTGLPESLIRDDVLLDSDALFAFFQQKIIGQDRAIQRLCEIIKIFKAGLNNPQKPIATLLFAGPTGVGKTASAKALSEYFFGIGQKRSPLIRLDMSEFQHPMQINRLIGYGSEVGNLVQDVRERPFSVLLLDEIEKANPVVFDILLSVLDEGLLTDSFGRITNFRNSIIIMTSNLGASFQKSIGFGQSQDQEVQYLSAIRSFFRPEFVNRIDSILFFDTLDQTAIHKIAEKELQSLNKREGLRKRSIQLTFSKALIEFVRIQGFDENYGARPLQRMIEDSVVNYVSTWLLEHPEVSNRTLEVGYNPSKGIVIV